MSFWAVNTEILACLELRKHSRGFLPEFRNVLIRMRQRKRIKTQYEASWSWNAKIKHQHIINIYQRPFMTLRIYSLVHVNSFKCSITVGRKRLDCCWIWTQYWIYMFLTKRVDGKRSKAESIKWGKHGFLDACRIVSSQPLPSQCSGVYGRFIRTISSAHLCCCFPQVCLIHLSFLSSIW